MQSNLIKRLTYAFGIVMLVAMFASVFVPFIRQEVRNQPADTPVPTPVPVATFPPPPDVSTITFDQTYLHPSGLFTVAEPVGWIPGQATNNGVYAQVSMNNRVAQSVIEAYVEVPRTPVTTPDELSAHFTESILGSGWLGYTDWKETGRRQDGEKLLIDFELENLRQTYLARHVAWTDGEWIYVVRVVTPENARDTLLFLLDKEIPTLQPIKKFSGTPTRWSVYFDNQDKHIIRYPGDWTITDSAPGMPASIGKDATSLRVESGEAAVEDESAARAWIEAAHPGATILSVQPVERDGNSGFSVAYSYADPDGEPISGLAVLLNGPDDRLHVANLRFPASAIDLNNLGEMPEEPYASLAQAMGTFTLMPDLNATLGTISPST